MNRYAVYLPWVGSETDVINFATRMKRDLKSENYSRAMDYVAKNFLLINIAHDADTYCNTTYGAGFCDSIPGKPDYSPCYPTVNRSRLTSLLKWLSQNRSKYNKVILDIIFKDRAIADGTADSLEYYLTTLQKDSAIIFAGVYDYNLKKFNNQPLSGVLDDANTGAVNEELTEGVFFRYRLTYNDGTVKSLPALMYERIHETDIKMGRFGLLTYQDVSKKKIRAANYFIPEMNLSPEDFDKLPAPEGNATPDSNLARLDLWQSVRQCGPIEYFYLKQALGGTAPVKKNIFIGSFSHDHDDMHKTVYGDLDGSIILLNIYYSLVKKQNQTGFWHQLFIFCSFYLIFLRIIVHPHSTYKGNNIILQNLFNWFFENLHYFLLIVMTVVSNLVFGKVTNIILLAGLFFLTDKAVIIVKTYFKSGKKGKKNRADVPE